jgi:hypothetical protein
VKVHFSMASITFGSVGDIIAVAQLACALAQALRDSRGSGKEYQGLVKELQAFDQALLQVISQVDGIERWSLKWYRSFCCGSIMTRV